MLAANSPASPKGPRAHSYLAGATGSRNLQPLLWFLSNGSGVTPDSPHSPSAFLGISKPVLGRRAKKDVCAPLYGLRGVLGSVLLLSPLHCRGGLEASVGLCPVYLTPGALSRLGAPSCPPSPLQSPAGIPCSLLCIPTTFTDATSFCLALIGKLTACPTPLLG